jgi:hypothetical protein
MQDHAWQTDLFANRLQRFGTAAADRCASEAGE